LFAKFHFWNSGDVMQTSLIGLYRSVLFETLKCCPDLIPVVFPRQWDQLMNRMHYVSGNLFSASDIKGAFEMLTIHGRLPHHCLCLFIDGLDEYNGESQDHVQLSKALQQWTKNDDVKICATSRPYIEFDNLAPSPDQTFHLHELTRNDIYLFCRQMIRKDDNFNQVRDSYLHLVGQIVNMSQGVFLWARLVVSSLLAGMLRHDTAEALERKLKALPRGIDELYNKMLDSLEPDDQERAAKMLLMTLDSPLRGVLPLNYRAYGWVDRLDDPEFPPRDGRPCPSWKPADTMAEDVSRQLKGLTKGLLEIAPVVYSDIRYRDFRMAQFFHRTVKDFVMNSPRLLDISRRYPPLLRAEWYFRLLLADLALGDLKYQIKYWERFMMSKIPTWQGVSRKLPYAVLEGFSRILDKSGLAGLGVRISKGSGISWESKAKGCRSDPYRPMLFLHFAAALGQGEYVLRAARENPELLRENGQMHLLLTAAVQGHGDLVAALLKLGLSPTDHILLSCSNDAEPQYVPVWVAAVAYIIVAERLLGGYSFAPWFDILESLLGNPGVNAADCVLVLEPHSSSERPGFLTLEAFVQFIQPKNKDRLISLIHREHRGSLFEGARRLLSPFMLFSKPMPPPGTSKYIFKDTSGETNALHGRISLFYKGQGPLDIRFRII
jgi:hypothetical protein